MTSATAGFKYINCLDKQILFTPCKNFQRSSFLMYYCFLKLQEKNSRHVVTASASISEHNIHAHVHVAGDCKFIIDVMAIAFISSLLEGQHLQYTFPLSHSAFNQRECCKCKILLLVWKGGRYSSLPSFTGFQNLPQGFKESRLYILVYWLL